MNAEKQILFDNIAEKATKETLIVYVKGFLQYIDDLENGFATIGDRKRFKKIFSLNELYDVVGE